MRSSPQITWPEGSRSWVGIQFNQFTWALFTVQSHTGILLVGVSLLWALLAWIRIAELRLL